MSIKFGCNSASTEFVREGIGAWQCGGEGNIFTASKERVLNKEYLIFSLCDDVVNFINSFNENFSVCIKKIVLEVNLKPLEQPVYVYGSSFYGNNGGGRLRFELHSFFNKVPSSWLGILTYEIGVIGNLNDEFDYYNFLNNFLLKYNFVTNVISNTVSNILILAPSISSINDIKYLLALDDFMRSSYSCGFYYKFNSNSIVGLLEKYNGGYAIYKENDVFDFDKFVASSERSLVRLE